jgi:hypothetical protein
LVADDMEHFVQGRLGFGVAGQVTTDADDETV